MLRIMKKKTGAFTLVEILAVMLLIGGLLGIAAVGISSQVQRGRQRTAKAQIATFEQAVSLFELECGFYPSSLEDLIANNSGQKCKDYPEEGFLGKKEIPMDPWQHEYNYQKPGSHNTKSYDVWSDGPKTDDDSDDITNWKSDNEE